MAELSGQSPRLAAAIGGGHLLARIRRLVAPAGHGPVRRARYVAGALVLAAFVAAGAVLYGCDGAAGKPVFEGTIIDAVVVADARGRAADPKKRRITEADQICGILAGLERDNTTPTGGKDRWTVTLLAGGKTVKDIWVFDYGEWGYGGRTRGTSGALAPMLKALLAAKPPEGERPSGAWGTTTDGLRCRSALDKASVPMGAVLDVAVHLGFDPTDVEADLNLINRAGHVQQVALTLKNTKTGKVYRRSQYDPGMPPAGQGTGDIIKLRGKPLLPAKVRVYLLSSEGEQVPSGTYAVTASYRNTTDPNIKEPHLIDGKGLVWRPYKEKFWRGTVASAPLILTTRRWWFGTPTAASVGPGASRGPRRNA
jgi:hypothetical protein